MDRGAYIGVDLITDFQNAADDYGTNPFDPFSSEQQLFPDSAPATFGNGNGIPVSDSVPVPNNNVHFNFKMSLRLKSSSFRPKSKTSFWINHEMRLSDPKA